MYFFFVSSRVDVIITIDRFYFYGREGVQFMFECVSGLSSAEGISGCILADDMG